MANEFQVHILNDAGIQKAKMLGAAFDLIVANLDVIGIGTGRERSLVITKLQEASFFAKRGMAMDPSNQKTE